MQLLINSIEKLRAIWPLLTAEQLTELEQDGTIRRRIMATCNASVLGRRFTGQAAVRAVWAYGDRDDDESVIGVLYEWQFHDLLPETAFKLALTVIGMEPALIAKLIEFNGGTMPEILPPVASASPEPAVDPTPESASEPTPEPVTEPAPEPAVDPAPEPVTEPTPEPASESTLEPVADPTPEPASEPTPEPVADPTPEPASEPTPEPVTEPAPEPASEPTPAPPAQP